MVHIYKQGKPMDISKHNAVFWDIQAELQNEWSRPVSYETVEAAKNGQWEIHLTKNKLPESWLPKQLKNKDILCLASAGGQQAPVLAAAGANVTVFDISEKQLELDRYIAKRNHLMLKTIQGNMTDLHGIVDGSFDYIIHPISNLYVPDLTPVWCECYRVLRPQGVLLTSFYNPILFVFEKNKELEEKGLLNPKFKLPYSDIDHLEASILNQKTTNKQALIFGHTLSSQINGQLEAGFLLSGFYEDEHPSPRFLIEEYTPTMIATKAIKL